MMPLSLTGLVGAMIGTIVAGIVYHLFIDRLERGLSGDSLANGLAADRQKRVRSVVRRLVLAIDLAALAALGYWLGHMFDD